MNTNVSFEGAESQRQKEIRIQQLFQAMQTAERSKDMDPAAYRKARVTYYRAAEGDQWIDTEIQKLTKEAREQTDQWMTRFEMLQGLRTSHRDNLDAVRAADVNQGSLHKDVQFAIRELRRLANKETDQKNVLSREAELRTINFGPASWVTTLFDALIVVLLLAAIYSLYSYLGPRWAAASAVIANERARLAQYSYLNAVRNAFV